MRVKDEIETIEIHPGEQSFASSNLPGWIAEYHSRLDAHDRHIVGYVGTVAPGPAGVATINTRALSEFVGLDLYAVTIRIIDLITDGFLICDDRYAANYSLRIPESPPGDRPDRRRSRNAA
ncbi:MAG: hypothetical protein RIF32_11060 [Leptospirales bacterium]|jgi:hypothetical protein